jgi:hypothetical protein
MHVRRFRYRGYNSVLQRLDLRPPHLYTLKVKDGGFNGALQEEALAASFVVRSFAVLHIARPGRSRGNKGRVDDGIVDAAGGHADRSWASVAAKGEWNKRGH